MKVHAVGGGPELRYLADAIKGLDSDSGVQEDFLMIAASEDFVMDLLRRARVVYLGAEPNRFAPPRAAGQPRISEPSGNVRIIFGARRRSVFLHVAKTIGRVLDTSHPAG